MKKFALGCLVSLGLVLVLVVGAFVWVVLREGPVLDGSLSVPADAALGSTFTIVVTAHNPHDRPVTLDSIDISDSFLAGFQVLEIRPAASSTMHVGLVRRRSWEFRSEVLRGDTLRIEFRLRAVARGRFTGEVAICNPTQDEKTLLADVVVR